MGPTVLLDQNNYPLPFILITNLSFQPCDRSQGNLILFHDLNNHICVPVILAKTTKQFTIIAHETLGI